MDRLFVVTRKDLPAGAQAAQSLHAFRQFITDHPEVEKDWHTNSNTLVIKAVENEDKLWELFYEVQYAGFKVSYFLEPDFEHDLTAITIEPSAKKFVRSIPLALS